MVNDGDEKDNNMPGLLKRPNNKGIKADTAVKIIIKKEILTSLRAYDNQHDTRSRKMLPERYSIISTPPLLLYQSYAVKLYTSIDIPYADTL